MKSMSESILIRADAGAEIGTGHLMRCLALAQAWIAEGGRITFLSCCDSPAFRHRVNGEGARFVPLRAAHPDPTDWQTTARLLKRLQPDWLVIDGYHFGPDYQGAVRAAGVRVLAIDDLAQWPEYHADILLNQNLDAKNLHYSRDRDTKLILGMRYVMMRREFLNWRGRPRRFAPVGHRLLVTMGGSDPGNVTLKVIRALDAVHLPGLEAVIVAGVSNPHYRQLLRMANPRRPWLRVERNVQNMPGLMAWADMALTTAGGTLWELLFMGCPTMSFTRMPVQEADYRDLEQRGVMRCLGNELAAKPEPVAAAIRDVAHSAAVRRRMSALGRRLVDGQGAARVVRAMRRRADGSRARRGRLVQGAER
jgi:UDP-2,4-diacetamido-2,4,6-trideoxy-beta-L-altropyranose hydrolase